jgi:hypothetical protein
MGVGESERERETGFADKSTHASITNHYNSDGLDSLCVIVQRKSSILKFKFKT